MDNINEKEKTKILFIYNALQDGWTIKKTDNFYIFKKKHENKKKYLSEDFFKKIYFKI